VVRATAAADSAWLDSLEVPLPTPAAGSTVEFLHGVFGRNGQWPALEAALKKPRADDPRSELEGIVREQYQLMRRHRMGLVLLTRSALEFPGLEEVFVLGLRKRLLAGLERYIDSRIAAGQFRATRSSFATAAVLTQTIAWANHQRPFDPGLKTIDEQTAEDATVDMLVNGLLAR
jgi:hypothetical protein